MVQSIFRWMGTAALGLSLLVSTAAYAMTVDDIMNMVNVNVPPNIVVQTMRNSGTQFTQMDVQALQAKGAPPAIIAAAQAMTAPVAPAPTAVPVAPQPVAPSPFNGAAPLGGQLNVPSGQPVNNMNIENDAGGPPALQSAVESYRKKDYIAASGNLFVLLNDAQYKPHETKIKYYLAKALYDLGMYHMAQHYFMEVVRKGPSNPYFKYALPRLVAIAEYTGNNYELLRIVAQIAPETYPRQARDHLLYLLGRKMFEEQRLSDAAKYFGQVSEKSESYMRARYFEGVIHQERGKLRSAVTSFRAAIQAEPPVIGDARRAKEIEDLKDQALINIARIYFGLERFDNADNYYAMVSRDSTYWPESLFERAWTNFWQADLNDSLGLLLTVESPYYNDGEFIPEVTILRALTFFNLCEYDEVEGVIERFDAKYNPMTAEMDRFLTQYKPKGMRAQAFDAYFVKAHEGSTLEKSLFNRVLRNRDLAAMVRHLDMMEEEVKLIDSQSTKWKSVTGTGLKTLLEADRQRYKAKAGTLLLKAVHEQNQILKDLLIQSEIIGFEVVDAQRQDYEFKMKNADVEVNANRVVDFATSTDVIYWPFNGEFWRDELGYYRYTEDGSCK